MPGLLKDWKDGVNVSQRLYELEQLVGQLTNVVTPAFSASIAVDASTTGHAVVTATSGAAFTIAAPSNAAKGRLLTFDIVNSSGGALGAITWDASLKMAGAFTAPANGKRRTITFRHDGSSFVEQSRSTADI